LFRDFRNDYKPMRKNQLRIYRISAERWQLVC
jgi:hypothetical protein